MLIEAESAARFVASLIEGRGKLPTTRTAQFAECLQAALLNHYQDHWFPRQPFRGSAYRCIRVTLKRMDPLLLRAGAACGLTEDKLLDLLPADLTLWVDPQEVTYRIGEEGSIGLIYESTEPLPLEPSPPSPITTNRVHSSRTPSPVIHSGTPSPVPSPYSSPPPSKGTCLLRSCKDELFRHMLRPDGSSVAPDTISLEYLSSFVAS